MDGINPQDTFNQIMQGYQLGANVAEQQRQRQMAEQQQQRAQQYKQQFASVVSNPAATAEDYMKLQAEYPEQAQAIKDMMGQKSKEEIQNDTLAIQQMYYAANNKNWDVFNQFADERIDALKNSGREQEAKGLEALKQNAEVVPEAVPGGLMSTLAALMGPEEFRKFYQEQQSASARLKGEQEERTQASEILPDGTTIFATTKQKVKVVDPAGNVLTGKDAADAIKEAKRYGVDIEGLKSKAREEEKLGAQIGTKATIAEQVKAAEKGAEVAINKSKEFVDKYEKVQQNIGTLDEGIAIIEKGLAEGKDLGVGPIRKYFPKWGVTANELKNVTNRMGLDVVSSVTFGALSENELKMAMDTAMPTNLSGQALLKWMKDRKAAQEKYADYLSKAAQFIGSRKEDGTVNTVQDWMAYNEAKKKQQTTELRTQPDLKSIPVAERLKMLQGP